MRRVLDAIFGSIWEVAAEWWDEDKRRGFPMFKGIGLCVLSVAVFYGIMLLLKIMVGMLLNGSPW